MEKKSNTEVLGQWAEEDLSADDREALAQLVHSLPEIENDEAWENSAIHEQMVQAGKEAVENALKTADDDEAKALEDQWQTTEKL